MPRTYLDHNATTPLHPSARDAMAAAFEVFGNPSSLHAEGRRARATIDRARSEVAELIGSAVEDIIFTSGGTEALNIVLTPDLTLETEPFDHLLMSAGEHPAVQAGHRFAAADTLPLTSDGVLDLDALEAALRRHSGRRVLVALQAANNETGVVQPVAAAAALTHAHGGYFVCDAVQAPGKIGCRIEDLGADALAISAHKFGGPKGVGALCFASSRHHLVSGVVRGGGQERGLRAGTENVVGIAGFGAACAALRARRPEEAVRIEKGRAAVERGVIAAAPNAVVFGQGVRRLSNTSCFAVPGLEAQILLMNLDVNGVAVSAGSACASGRSKPSYVLTAMGIKPDLAASAVRVSLGWTTTERDVEAFADAFERSMKTMGSRRAA
jgi:cysteine desulfurase